MPKRTDIKNILIIGSGPIIIGQACEFDYAGTQACIALKEEGYRTVLINSNPASIMTDPHIADVTYIESITLEVVKKIIQKEKIDAILTTVGGQMGLNLACELDQDNFLEEAGVILIGADRKIIERAENRKKFQELIQEINLETPLGYEINELDDAYEILNKINFPLIIRSSFTLGGKGAVIVNNFEEFETAIRKGLKISPVGNVLIEESIIGWKEFELELIRDKNDNCIVICSIENVDPMGIHTGDSIAVAPALTLTDKEFQIMRDQAFLIIRAVGVETGGANVQFAVNPKDGRLVVIEMNPRVSRSSALASKATGYPIAKIAAKLAVGYTLDEISNELTGNISAAFEPSIDYIVTKIPRFDFEKFPSVIDSLHISMQSMGEVMAIGRSFRESFQKAIRSLEKGYEGLNFPISQASVYPRDLIEKIKVPSSLRFFYIAEGYRKGLTSQEINELSGWDLWFLEEIKALIDIEKYLQSKGLPRTNEEWAFVKSAGFSDKRIAQLTGSSLEDALKMRLRYNLYPSCFRIDSCAGQFQAQTNYLYLTYQKYSNFENESEKQNSKQKKIIILGSGPNCISQGIEFDYCCVHAAQAIKALQYQVIMINCNPETVSTDHTISDKLYFSPLVEEEISEIIRQENTDENLLGVMIQFGGQTSLKHAYFLTKNSFPLIGTQYHSIHLTEDRDKFREILKQLRINQPYNLIANDRKAIVENVLKIGFPVILRPSYVIGGKGMEIISSLEDLEHSRTYRMIDSFKPILIEKYLDDAIEVEIDALSDKNAVCIVGVVEHFEKAGIHSGDSHFSFPPFSLDKTKIELLINITNNISKYLKVKGLINIQFAIQSDKIYVLEVNLRASRNIPFLSKATHVPISQLAAKVALGLTLEELKMPQILNFKNFYFKQPIFSFSALPNAKYNLGPEMRSTGEQMHIGKNFEEAFKKLTLSMKTNKRDFILIYGNINCLNLIEELIHSFSSQEIKFFVNCEEKEFVNEKLTPYILNESIQCYLDKVYLVLDLTTNNFRKELRSYNEFYKIILIDNMEIIKLIMGFKINELQIDFKSLQEWNESEKPSFIYDKVIPTC
ncbi:carbamoyl-phosphate synthase large subunit [Candidatus Protochlamydia sp. W-9]|uniref:carbamoyl-phosphate synthase large subunit n=1 Tax=Candidatus Protochlamydia sp. W-9 TaxID=1785087 RepID=UPI00096A5796|nr:carbamoyl-phosphate synthase large subunit [Candidatus Protochlamydia sp. W-9]